MSLSEHLSTLGIPHQIDSRARHRFVESDGSIVVDVISADSGSLALDLALLEPATPLAFVTSSGRFTILNLGLVGTIYLHGPNLTEPQESAMTQLAARLRADLDVTIEGYPVAPVKKTRAKSTTSVELDADPVLEEVDTSEPTE